MKYSCNFFAPYWYIILVVYTYVKPTMIWSQRHDQFWVSLTGFNAPGSGRFSRLLLSFISLYIVFAKKMKLWTFKLMKFLFLTVCLTTLKRGNCPHSSIPTLEHWLVQCLSVGDSSTRTHHPHRPHVLHQATMCFWGPITICRSCHIQTSRKTALEHAKVWTLVLCTL